MAEKKVVGYEHPINATDHASKKPREAKPKPAILAWPSGGVGDTRYITRDMMRLGVSPLLAATEPASPEVVEEPSAPPIDAPSLHDDLGMHKFQGIFAQMTDGRTVQLDIDAHGHMGIIDVLHDPEPPTPPEPQPSDQPGDGKSQEAEREMREAAARMGKALERKIEAERFKPDDHEPSPDPREDATGESRASMSDPVFLARLASIMNDNQFDRRLKGRSRGKLDMTRLYKAQTGSRSVFTQKALRRNKQYNVVLVVDESGSMRHSGKIQMAGKTTQFLATHLARIPGVSLAILGFNHYLRLHKDFDQTVDLTKLASVVEESMDSGGGCNADYNALVRAYELLEDRDGQNLVLFTSDGEPASCGNCDGGASYREIDGREVDVDDPKEIRHMVTKHDKLATTVGIGIMSNPTQTPHAISVNNLNQLKPAIIGILQKEIKRG